MSTYNHKHHIIPKHMGGTDDPSNIIELTIEEHAEAHKKLYETYGKWEDKIAWMGLAKMIDNKECIRIAMIEGAKKGGSMSKGKTGIGIKKGTKFSDETKAKMSAAKKGKKQSQEHIEKLRAIKLGKKHKNKHGPLSVEHKQKLREARYRNIAIARNEKEAVSLPPPD